MQNKQAEAAPHKLALLQQQFAEAMLDYRQTDSLQANLQHGSVLEDKIALYRGNLSAIWRNTLQNAYPVLAELVGADYFAQLAKAYGIAVPSVSGDLNELGAGLANFLRQQADLAAQYPYFAEIAELEWALHRAYYAADPQQFGLADLQQFALQHEAVGGLGGLALSLNPGISCLDCEWNALSIWQAHQSAEIDGLPALEAGRNHVLIYRAGWHAQPASIQLPEYVALTALAAGQPLAAALESALESDQQFDPAAGLANWFALGLFDGCYLPAHE